jgi:hypothetical protein
MQATKSRARIATVVLLLIFGGALCAYLVVKSLVNEPSYAGRGISQWVPALDNPKNKPEFDAARDAVDHMGTNAVPYLLELLSAKPSKSKLWFYKIVTRFGNFPIERPDPVKEQSRGLSGYRVLRQRAAYSLPDLERILGAHNYMYVISAMRSCGTNGLAFAERQRTNGNEQISSYVRRLEELRKISKDPPR